jgi:hypothetical protein
VYSLQLLGNKQTLFPKSCNSAAKKQKKGGVIMASDEQLNKIARQRQQANLFNHEGALDAEEIIEDRPADNAGNTTYPTYVLSVNYERSVEDGVRAGRYDWVNRDITHKNFPRKKKGTAKVAVELVHFDRYISVSEALCELKENGYRPADLWELLAFGEKYPEVQINFTVAALGSIYRHPNGHYFSPLLYGFNSRRRLGLFWLGGNLQKTWRVAAVRVHK